MSFRGRTAILWWSLQTVFNTHLSHCLRPSPIHFKFYSLAQPQVSGHLVDHCDEFLPWLEWKAGSRISSSLSIGKSSYGRSLFASKIIRTGDCILQVPYSVGSEWEPYISCLPQQGELHNTIFWNESELEMIRQSSVYQETINQKSQIEKDFLAIRLVFESFPQSFGDFTFKDFMHACTQVGSRAWGSTKGLSLIPFADFLNHDGVSEAIVMSADDKQCSEVTADRDYAPGEQVLIRYGKFSNATLMLDFGFTIPHNIYDQIQFDVPEHDPLHDMKLGLLQRYFVPPTEDMKGLKYSVNSFTIKEVRSARGKGKGLPQSLRAVARVLSCTTPQELTDLVVEAAQTDGRLARRPLQDINKEMKAHLMLSSLFTQLIEERNATAMSLDSFNSPSLCERLPVRRQMAQDLLHGELRILKSASAWLENYCFSLTR